MTDTPLPGDDLQAQAVLWVVRVGDPDFLDWEAFETWLGANPAHALAYHAAVDAEQLMVDRLVAAPSFTVPTALAERGVWRRSAPWVGGALAASLVLVASFGILRPGGGAVIYQTGPGGHRDIVLADGSHIALNGDTRVSVAANDQRKIRLERGEALFTVRHDPGHPFSVTVGDATIADLGTIFDVLREPTATRVAVAQGTVMWNPAKDAVRLDAGRGLHVDDDGEVQHLALKAATVGEWSTGQLSYEGAPLSIVAGDISRTLGITISVAPNVAAMPVRGILRLDGGAETVLPRLAALLGLQARHDGAAWGLTSSP